VSVLLDARGLVKAFNDMIAVDRVDITLERGRITSVIGPNGAGKTTLIHLLTGHLLPDDGTIRFGDAEITTLPAHQRVRRGLCRTFQIVDIFPRLTVFENVQLAVITRKGGNFRFLRPAAGEEREEVEQALQDVGMWELRERRAEQLSHGQQRRLDLAVSLATRPRLCFLDEPTSGVSPQERDQMLVLIRELAAGRDTTFVIVEHDMEVVFDLSAWIAVMHRGRILAEGSPEEIRAHPEVREVYLGEEA
jgi:branched-chain amino acid transport system ATP-binding protein